MIFMNINVSFMTLGSVKKFSRFSSFLQFYVLRLTNSVSLSWRLHFSKNLFSITCLALSRPSLNSSCSPNNAKNLSLHCSREGRLSLPSSLGLSMSSKKLSHILTCHHRLNVPFTTQRFLEVPTSIYLPNSRQ